ncbi:App1 family protein [Anatilimnocola aggregata]|uniref:App1 family protein n=1 Tax=Anatilimnocola aggregata TaxID=2528021 RepID=UPI00119DE3DF|nr:phosphatase domain-containing protein [Anatilimnocola aggregata]
MLSRVLPRRTDSLTNLQADEQVVLFPTIGYRSADGRGWHVQVHGDVFSQGPIGLGKRFLLKLLQRLIKAPADAFQSELFRYRVQRFLAKDEAGKQMAVKLGENIYVLPKRSRKNGHFLGTLRLDEQHLLPLVMAASPTQLQLALDVCNAQGDGLGLHGQVHLIEPEGVSVISDIDDTLKHSNVICRRTLLTNTFLKEFEPIVGMAQLFQAWEAQGAAFHYVSSCPWQLYQHLQALFGASGFPGGSFHLRAFRLRDHLLRKLLLMRRSGKAVVIHSLLKLFPKRRFILVGDNVEADPEIYGAAARHFPDQVQQIYIRSLSVPRHDPARYAAAFRGLRPGMVRMFTSASDIAHELPPR